MISDILKKHDTKSARERRQKVMKEERGEKVEIERYKRKDKERGGGRKRRERELIV